MIVRLSAVAAPMSSLVLVVVVIEIVSERRVRLAEGVTQPPRIDANDDHEERKREQEMHCLKDLKHLFWRAAIEVVDVENDPVDAIPGVAGTADARELFLERL